MYYVAGDSAQAGRSRRRGGCSRSWWPWRRWCPGGARRERVVLWKAPFGAADTTTLYQADGTISSLAFTDDGKQIFVGTTANNNGEIYHVDLATPTESTPSCASAPTRRLSQRAAAVVAAAWAVAAEQAVAPRLLTIADVLCEPRRHADEAWHARRTGGPGLADGAVFLTGTQFFPNYLQNAPRAFVDKVEIKTGTRPAVPGAADALRRWPLRSTMTSRRRSFIASRPRTCRTRTCAT